MDEELIPCGDTCFLCNTLLVVGDDVTLLLGVEGDQSTLIAHSKCFDRAERNGKIVLED